MAKKIKIKLHYGDRGQLEHLGINKFGPFFYIQDELEEANAIVALASTEFAYSEYSERENIELITDSEPLMLVIQRAIKRKEIKPENVEFWFHSSESTYQLRLDEEGGFLDAFPDNRYSWRFEILFT